MNASRDNPKRPDRKRTVQHAHNGEATGETRRKATYGFASVLERHDPETSWKTVAQRINRLREEGFL